MSGSKKRWPAAAVAGGLVVLAALTGCGGEESVASKSAAAFEKAQKRGETFAGEGHAHGGHATAPPGGEPSEAMPQETANGEEHHHGHSVAAAPAVGGMQHAAEQEGSEHATHRAADSGSSGDHSAMRHGSGAQAGGHAAMSHGGSASPGQPGRSGDTAEHAGHGAPAAQPPGGHAGHSSAGSGASGTPSRAPEPELPAQPASILQPDRLDAPAATAIVDAQRSAEMSQAMSGGTGSHGGHGEGTYQHIDAGRGPGASEGSEPQTPGAGPQHHGHGSAEPEAALYVCPMHPEVTSNTPGTCTKCGMTLVKRSKP